MASAFLGSPRSAVVAAMAIPMSLVTVFIVMHFTRMPANLFSLGAIDFGIIVDGAIVVMEAILRRREEEPDATLTEGNILETVSHVSGPIFFATLIIITAYFPLFAFERAEGKLFSPMAQLLETRSQQLVLSSAAPMRSQWNCTFTRPYWSWYGDI